MIVTRLMGGLGNQMFQYAAGRAMSLRLGVPLRVDLSDFDRRARPTYQLERAFGLTAEAVSARELWRLGGWRTLSPLIWRLTLSPAGGFLRSRAVRAEPHFHYWSALDSAAAPAYLSGYWQSERYFSDQQEAIRADFQFADALAGTEAELANRIRGCNSVSIHVRRGDYASDIKAHAVHGLCSLDYYRRSVAQMRESLNDPHFFVFSDDIDWARGNLSLDNACYVSSLNAARPGWSDMRLMSLCRHHILANSTFSWWAAWLNTDAHKQVIAPMRWFTASGRDTQDLCPRAWLRL